MARYRYLFVFFFTLISPQLGCGAVAQDYYTDAFKDTCLSLKRLKEHYDSSSNVFAGSFSHNERSVPIFRVTKVWKGSLKSGEMVAFAKYNSNFVIEAPKGGEEYIFFSNKGTDDARLSFPLYATATCRPPIKLSSPGTQDVNLETVTIFTLDDFSTPNKPIRRE